LETNVIFKPGEIGLEFPPSLQRSEAFAVVLERVNHQMEIANMRPAVSTPVIMIVPVIPTDGTEFGSRLSIEISQTSALLQFEDSIFGSFETTHVWDELGYSLCPR